MKKFKIKVQFTIEREYLDEYTEEMVMFNCNESSSCANNMISDYLKSVEGKNYGECSCFNAEAISVKQV